MTWQKDERKKINIWRIRCRLFIRSHQPLLDTDVYALDTRVSMHVNAEYIMCHATTIIAQNVISISEKSS